MSEPNPTITDIKNSSNHVAAAIAAGAALERRAEVLTIEGRPHLILPGGYTVQDLTKFLPVPPALEQQVTLLTPVAFGSYVKTFGVAEQTIVFASREHSWFMAALDYHKSPTEPTRSLHRAHLRLQPTLPWQEWTARDKNAMTQADFARFVEDHIPDIAEPLGAVLVEMVRNFEAQKGVTYQSYMRENDGTVKFTYNEEVGSTGAGKASTIKVPQEFTLGLAPFEGTAKYEVKARLRWRIADGGKLSLWFELVRPKDVLDAAFLDVYTAIEKDVKASIKVMVLGQIER